MALLDIQAMDPARDNSRCGGGGGGSDLSVALCDSFASTLLCL
jgi:Lanthionine-containing peptide SapB precursor RamS